MQAKCQRMNLPMDAFRAQQNTKAIGFGVSCVHVLVEPAIPVHAGQSGYEGGFAIVIKLNFVRF